jgi:hypothetical protein
MKGLSKDDHPEFSKGVWRSLAGIWCGILVVAIAIVASVGPAIDYWAEANMVHQAYIAVGLLVGFVFIWLAKRKS